MKISKINQYKNNLFHSTNNGEFMYLQQEFNNLIYDGKAIPQSKFVKSVEECTKLKWKDNIDYLKGDISELYPYKINSGTESIVLNNTPFSVIKIIKTSPKQMYDRNIVPTSVPCTLRAIIENNDQIYYVYTQVKVNVVKQEDLTYAFKKLDIEMMKYGYFQVLGYSDDKIRVYTDGFVVIDDVSLGNIGYSIDNKLHIIDCQVFDIDDWEEFNEFKVPNKIVSIYYNSNSLLRKKLEDDLKVSEFDIHQEIRNQQNNLDNILKQNNINLTYTHL